MSETTAPMLLTFDDLARELRIGRRTANRLLSAGKLPPADLNVTGGAKGRRWRADRLRAWVDAGAPNAAAWRRHVAEGAR